VRLEVFEQTLKLAAPFVASYGTVRTREILVVALTTSDGITGFGEAAPLPAYDGVSLNDVRAALARYGEVLRDPGADGQPIDELLAACGARCPLPQALAAIDVAVWDIRARTQEVSLAAALSAHAPPAARVAVNASVWASDPTTVADQSARAAAEGYRCIKLKVGAHNDAERVRAARAGAGAQMDLRLDANGAWSPEQAPAAIAALAPAGLELVEEPVHGVAAMRSVRGQVTVPIAIDETAAEAGAIESGCADAVCLKLSRCGGLSGLLADAARARAAGMRIYLASTLDGVVGVAAAVHAAAALGGQAALGDQAALGACGLATLALFEGHGHELPVQAGSIAVPRTPGLGVEPV
jgi:L-alanine-DL-glutamate epimerase-like enolase superfamily enzyme